jgi:hypothetical protein
MESETRKELWAIIQAVGAIYCAGIGTWALFHPPMQTSAQAAGSASVTPSPHIVWWFWILIAGFIVCALTLAIGTVVNIFSRRLNRLEDKTMPTVDGILGGLPKQPDWRDAFRDPRFILISGHKYENDSVQADGKSFRRCSFRNVTFNFHGNAPFEFVEETQLEAGSVRFVTDNPAIILYNEMTRKFSTIASGRAKVETGVLDAKGHEIPLQLPTVRAMSESQNRVFISVNVVSVSPDEKKISRGRNIKIRYVIESSEDAADRIWLGASVLTDPQTGKYFSNTNQDKYISLVKGRHEYDRDLSVPLDAPLGTHMLRANVWRDIAEGKSMIIAKGMTNDIEIVT